MDIVLFPPPSEHRRAVMRQIGTALRVMMVLVTLGVIVRAITGNQTPDVVIPPQSVPNPNAFDVFVQAGKLTVKNKDALADALVPKPGKQWSHQEKAALLARNAPALARRGLRLPCRDASSPRSFRAEFPHYATFRNLARLMILDGEVKRENGDVRGAVQSDADAVIFGHTLLRGAPLVGHLVGRACEAIGRKPLWKMAVEMDAQTAQQTARRLEAVCENDPASSSFADALTEEKWWEQASIMEFFKEHSDFSMAYVVWGKRTMINNNTSYMDQMIAAARKPYQVQPKMPSLPSDFFSQILLPSYVPARYKSEANNTQNALLAATLAVQAYRADHKGVCPENLSDLVPAYLSHVPVDPLSYPIAPLCYKRTSKAAGYVLWSVGPDGKNDDGTPITDYKPTSGPATGTSRFTTGPASKGDIVAVINTR